MDRRHFLAAGLLGPFALADRGHAQTPARQPAAATPLPPIGDMHFHSFFVGPGGAPSKYDSRPLARTLAAGGATLVAWSVVGDVLWVDSKTYKQKAEPKPGEPLGWFQRELGRVKAHVAEQGLKVVLVPADVDAALQGVPHVVLAVEGANFVENDVGRLQPAYDQGLRHLQLVHYTRNTIGDFQTEPAEHKGLTAIGKAVVSECNRLGILIDLAHCTPATVRDALAISRAPMVWSHGSVVRGRETPGATAVWRRRQLSLEGAKAIAGKGGVVGIWALNVDVGRTVGAYGDRLAELAGWLGEDHVAFGTDINGLGAFAMLSSYAEVRQVVEHWQRQQLPEARIRKLAIGNYARVLKAAMLGRQA